MKYTLGRKIYDGIKKDILQGIYPSNTFLTEGEIALKYGVSKAPVKTALKNLCNDGFLISYPRKGYFITNTNISDYSQIQDLRYAMESLTVSLLIQQATSIDIDRLRKITTLDSPSDPKYTTVNAQFHMAMAEITGNRYLIRYLASLLEEVSTIYNYLDTKNQPEDEQNCHPQLLDAIAAKDYIAANEWLRKDLSDASFSGHHSIVSFSK